MAYHKRQKLQDNDIRFHISDTRSLTPADREAGGALVDHLQKMGINVHTDNVENRRVLKEAQRDHSEVGKIRHMKTEAGDSYGFAYKGAIYLDLRKIDAELPLHEYAHLWCEAMRRINSDSWKHIVELMKGDADAWQYVNKTYPDLKDDDDLAEEIIARFSGKRGAQKLHDELYQLSLRDMTYQSRWGNIFQNLSKAIQDFWKHVGDSLNIHYESKEDIADQILKDFSNQVNPMKKIGRWMLERDKEYEAAVVTGDWDKARNLFVAALQEHVGNGITPFVAVDGYRGKLDRLARAVKDSTDHADSIRKAADLMAPLVPDNAVLVPTPSHKGYATDMLTLANAISERIHVPVADVLKSAPRERQYDVKKATGHPLTADELGIRQEGALPQGKLPVVIDNVVHSGNTAEACVKALGGGVVCSLASAVSQERHVSSLKSAQPVVYDKVGLLIPLSQRFELKNKYIGCVMEDLQQNSPKVLQGLESYSLGELESQVRQYAENILSEYFDVEDASIKKVTFVGSRTRGEAHDGSDLDVLIEYEGEGIREDTLFNALNEEPLEIEGIRVDMNPINPHYSLSTEEWLERDVRWREEDLNIENVKYKMDNMEAKEILKNKYDAFVREHQEEPKYAEVTIRFKDDNVQDTVLIQLDHGSDPRTDDQIFYYCGGLGDLEGLTQSERMEDFQIVDVDDIIFHGKNLLLTEEDVKIVEEHPQKLYQIITGEAPTPNVMGEFHVKVTDNINAVSFNEMKQIAEEYGGQMRVTNTQEWGDFFAYSEAEKFAEKVVSLNEKRMKNAKTDVEKLEAIGYPYGGLNEDGSFNIPTLDESLYWRYAAGIITLHEAARRLASAGWTNEVDEDFTLKRLNEIDKKWGKLNTKQLDKPVELSPIMKQFYDLKEKHPDALLLFRQGDFYETYQEDARKASEILGITLTKSSKRKGQDGKPLEMAGFPYHALDTYLPKLIRSQMRVAICDPIVTPKLDAELHEKEKRKNVAHVIGEQLKKVKRDDNQEGVHDPMMTLNENISSSIDAVINHSIHSKTDSFMEDKEKELQEQTPMQQKKEQEQEAVTAHETESQTKNTGQAVSIDYSKYVMPEGATVEKANVWKMKPKEGEEHGKYAISAIINGERKTATLFPNDLAAYFSKDVTKKVLLQQLVAKYFAKSTAIAMGIAPAEQKKVNTKTAKAQDAEKSQETSKQQAQQAKEKEAREIQADQDAKEQKQRDENKDSKESGGEAVQVGLLVGALLAAKEKGGVWLNEKGKAAPGFYPSGINASPFNTLMMAVHSDANGYKTNLYTNFVAAQKEGVSVSRGEKGLPYNWYDFDKYVNQYNKNDVIDKDAYQTLSEEEKELYKVLVSKDLRSVFNLDQTTMRMVKREEYNTLVPTEKKPLSLEQQFQTLKKENPEQVLLFRQENAFVAYNEDAEKIAEVLGVTPIRSVDSELERKFECPLQEMDDHLKKLISEGVSVAIVVREQESAQSLPNAETINAKVYQLVESMKEAYGDKLVTMPEESHYDPVEDVLTVQAQNKKVSKGKEKTVVVEKANNLYRAAVAFTGGSERINRTARGRMLPEDVVKHEALVQELAAGVLMVRQGLPAQISKENIAYIPYWERELKENPRLIVSLERDVNNAVHVLDKVQRGEQVDYSAIRGEKNIEVLQPKFYSISRNIAAMPNEETKEAVIIRDPKTSSAAVILPAGASLEVGNEIPGMSKNRFAAALKKEGYENVQFYNAGGALGFVQPNEYFADKVMTVSRLKNHDLITSTELNPKAEIARTNDAKIENLMAVKSPDNIMVFRVTTEEGKNYNITPSQTDLNQYFASFKDGTMQEVKQALGKKYFALATEHPELQVSLMPKAGSLDESRISGVGIFRDKFHEGQYIMFASIDGVKQKPVQLSADDYQRMWLVDDMKAYKSALASQIFSQKMEVEAHAQSHGTGNEQAAEQAGAEAQKTAEETAQTEQDKPKRSFHR